MFFCITGNQYLLYDFLDENFFQILVKQPLILLKPKFDTLFFYCIFSRTVVEPLFLIQAIWFESSALNKSNLNFFDFNPNLALEPLFFNYILV